MEIKTKEVTAFFLTCDFTIIVLIGHKKLTSYI